MLPQLSFQPDPQCDSSGWTVKLWRRQPLTAVPSIDVKVAVGFPEAINCSAIAQALCLSSSYGSKTVPFVV